MTKQIIIKSVFLTDGAGKGKKLYYPKIATKAKMAKAEDAAV